MPKMVKLAIPLSLAAILISIHKECSGNVYTSVMKMRKVPEIEAELIKYMQRYIETSQDDVNKRELNDFLTTAKESNEAIRENYHYVENPINAYRLLRRLSGSWSEVIQNITCITCDQSPAATEFAESLQNLKNTTGLWPGKEDFWGATMALIRLKNVYKLPMDDLGQGKIYDTMTAPLTAYEFSLIGDAARDKELAYESVLWYNQSVQLFRKESGVESSLIVRTMKKLASAWSNFGMPLKSKSVVEEALTIDPHDNALARDLEFYTNALNKLSQEEKKKVFKRPPNPAFPYYFKYEALCRGNIKSAREKALLYCDYRSTTIPIIKSKVEYANIDPPLVVFHDVISETEIDWMRNTAIEQLSRSVLGDVETRKGDVYSEDRISENAWLADNYDMAIKLGKRITLFTGLDASVRHFDTYAEPFQVLNYGLGGMYEPHYDYTKLYRDMGLEDNELFRNSGDRVATWMFYLSDVEAGGATVFPTMKTRVPPIKGSAAFWYNIKRNGEMDHRSLHAGCPVLLGTKWAANKWFRELGQAFRYGCSLNPNE